MSELGGHLSSKQTDPAVLFWREYHCPLADHHCCFVNLPSWRAQYCKLNFLEFAGFHTAGSMR